MLSVREKIFVVRTAEDMQKRLGMQYPNVYPEAALWQMIEELWLDVDPNFSDMPMFWKAVFHGLVAKLNLGDFSDIEDAEELFVHNMTMPREHFERLVTLNTDRSGKCNVFTMAEVLGVEYIDVICRGSELGCWNSNH